MRNNLRNALLALTVGVVAVSGCGTPAEVSSAGADSTPPSTSEGSDVNAELSRQYGVPMGHRVLVGGNTTATKDLRGYVNWDVIPGRAPDTSRLNPVYAEGGPSTDEGKAIAYWGTGVGWITLERYSAPEFDYDALLAEARAKDNAFVLDRSGSTADRPTS